MRISQIIFAISTMLILSSIASAYYVTVQSSPAGSGYEGVASTAVGYTCLSNQSCTYNFTSGTALTFYAYNFSNTTFTQWSGVGGAGAFSSSSGTAQTTLDSNITETASFQNTAPSTVYHLTIQNNCQSCGSTSPAVGTHAYASGTQVNLNEYPDSGYAALGWTGSGGAGTQQSSSGSTFVTMDSNITETASFQNTAPQANNLSVTLSSYSGQSTYVVGFPSGGTGPYVYQWYNATSDYADPALPVTAIPGQTSSVLSIKAGNSNATYIYFLKVTDSRGASANSSAIFITTSPPGTLPPTALTRYTIAFKSGWNLFSVPLKHVTSYVANSCNPTSSVWTLVDGRYIKTINILGGAGYWVYMPSNCSITVGGSALDNLSGYNLTAGWNMIGGPDTPTSFNQIKGTCNVTKGPYGYLTVTGMYHVASTLGSGNGYLVYVSDPCTLGAVNSSSPPPLP